MDKDLYFLSNIILKSELDNFIEEIDKLAESLFMTKGSSGEKLNAYISFENREALLTLCNRRSIHIDDVSKLKDFLVSLKKDLNLLPILELTLAFHPNREFLQRIGVWYMQREGKKVILSIAVSPKIIGGMVLSFKGIYKDFSIKKLVEQRIAENKLSFNL